MVEVPRSPESATYEIQLDGEVPASMWEEFPTMTIYHRPVETVLYKHVTDLAELDELLEQLQSMGLMLAEIREFSPDPSPNAGGVERAQV